MLRSEFSLLWFTVLQKCGHAVIHRFIHPKGCQLVLKTDHVLERCLRCESCGLFTLKVVVNGETETIIMGSNLLKMSISLPVPLWVQELYLTQMIHQPFQKPRINPDFSTIVFTNHIMSGTFTYMSVFLKTNLVS